MNDSFNRYVQGFLAAVISLGFFAVIGVLLWKTDIAAPVKDILLVMLGALLASWKELTGYFFGSSSGSAKKDDTNAALTAQLVSSPPIIPPTVPAVPVKEDSQSLSRLL
jgi:hypothetical protein